MTAGLATVPRGWEAEAVVPDLVLPAVTVRGGRRIGAGHSGGFLARLRAAAADRESLIIDLSVTETLDGAVAREVAGLYRAIRDDGRRCGVVCTSGPVLAMFQGRCRVNAEGIAASPAALVRAWTGAGS